MQGRFDREIFFPLPSLPDRAAILRVHTSAWPSPPPPPTLQALAKATPGYAGADLAALAAQVRVHDVGPMTLGFQFFGSQGFSIGELCFYF